MEQKNGWKFQVLEKRDVLYDLREIQHGTMFVLNNWLYFLQATKQTMLPFLPIYAWAGIWTCAFLLCLAAVEASNVVSYSFHSLTASLVG
jgi:hypothetical protein